MPSKKIIVRLAGGLGNQLFAYCAAKQLAVKNNCELVLDKVTGFESDVVYNRQYNLQPFNINERAATNSEMFRPFSKFRRSFFRLTQERKPFNHRRYICQEFDAFDSRLLDIEINAPTWIQGVWASEDYFKNIEGIIRESLIITPPVDSDNLDLQKHIKASNSIALHVRFFSQKDDPNSQNTSIEYYNRAIKKIRDNVEKPYFYVFSDQPERALDLLSLDKETSTFVTHNASDEMAYADIWLMEQCDHIIMANSTFSWWAAWLSEGVDKTRTERMLICPDPKKLGQSNWDIAGLVPKRWMYL